MTSVLILGMLTVSAPAHADRVDDLCRSLTTDPSWRVRLQAAVVLGKLKDERAVPSLLRGLADENETVRGLSAQVLGELGDPSAKSALERAKRDPSTFVRDKAMAALASLSRPPSEAHGAGGGNGALHVEIGGIGVKAPHVSPQMAIRLKEFIIRELNKTPGLTLEGKPISGFLIDSSITNVSRRMTPEWVEITCEISFVVGRLPSRAMVMMTSGGATVQAPRVGLRPEREQALQIDALEGAVEGAHQNLVAYIKGQRSAN
ncbi:MAG TPA: HEAT repeat domain-containing protein [Polyangia bacterium]|nr:HEAT repeat domain-containing protein [Polyangia bacterium]